MDDRGNIRRFDSDKEAEDAGFHRKLSEQEAKYLETIAKEERLETHRRLKGFSSQWGKNYFNKKTVETISE